MYNVERRSALIRQQDRQPKGNEELQSATWILLSFFVQNGRRRFDIWNPSTSFLGRYGRQVDFYSM